jgi:hypothetical protein
MHHLILAWHGCLEQQANTPIFPERRIDGRPAMTSPKLKIAIGVILAVVMALPLVG